MDTAAATAVADHTPDAQAPVGSGIATVAQRFRVDGMTCGHCVAAVTGALHELAGCTAVLVDLGAGTVIVESEAPLDLLAVDGAITAAGYELVSPAPVRRSA